MKLRKIGFWLVPGALILVAALIVIPALAASPPRLGGTAPSFALPDLRGNQIQLAAEIKSHRVTLVNFWATWCPPCRQEIPELIALYKRYKPQGLQLLAVDLREDPGEVKAFAARQGMTFPVLIDSNGRVADKYGIYYIPTTYILDGDGRIRAKFEGGTTASALRAKIDPLLKGK